MFYNTVDSETPFFDPYEYDQIKRRKPERRNRKKAEIERFKKERVYSHFSQLAAVYNNIRRSCDCDCHYEKHSLFFLLRKISDSIINRHSNKIPEAKMKPNRFLIIANVTKKANIKTLIYAAAAHGFTVVIVGLPNLLISDLNLADELISSYSKNNSSSFANQSSIDISDDSNSDVCHTSSGNIDDDTISSGIRSSTSTSSSSSRGTKDDNCDGMNKGLHTDTSNDEYDSMTNKNITTSSSCINRSLKNDLMKSRTEGNNNDKMIVDSDVRKDFHYETIENKTDLSNPQIVDYLDEFCTDNVSRDRNSDCYQTNSKYRKKNRNKVKIHLPTEAPPHPFLRLESLTDLSLFLKEHETPLIGIEIMDGGTFTHRDIFIYSTYIYVYIYISMLIPIFIYTCRYASIYIFLSPFVQPN